ncbi:hypothetical protein VB151_13605 [Xanthomonas fragariae]|nr:hypothetical protein [Xanthomonas fragariae]MBL9196136.1 hypothetical protein [Xanthomonas fragariae]MBL9220356.1 hypothetical protein [Xanthomonas fragariae]MDM7573170.1 hypothetical protein [Xanthomonas fragariae]MDM7582453.1 hypothetical protein [Xanthomonas fragariae]MEA5174663.1 hypothetical protein [Xanthomonas fragariae]
MRQSWRFSADIPEPHQLVKIQQRAVFFIMKRSEKMQSTKSNNRRTHAQSSYQSPPEQAAGQPAGAGTIASGMSSPSAPSGVLSELAARPNKRRRTEASAVRSAPGSGAHPAPNVTSTPAPSSALHYDGLPPNSYVQHSPLWRTDAPELQGATEQQLASEDAAVHKEHRAPDNRPSTSGRKRKVPIPLGTGSSDSDLPYPDDTPLIKRFLNGAKGEGKAETVRIYARLFEVFSAWLKQQSKGGLQDRLFKDELMLDAEKFQEETGRTHLIAAMTHLRAVESNGTVTISAQSQHVIPEGDKNLINNARSAIPSRCLTELRAFSAWLHSNDKGALCETGRLQSPSLQDDINNFLTSTNRVNSSVVYTALRNLDIFCVSKTPALLKQPVLRGTPAVRSKFNTSEIHEVDRQLCEQFKNVLSDSLSASGPEKRYTNGQTYSSRMSSFMRSFSAWLKANQKAPMAKRLQDPTLDEDLKLFTDSDRRGDAMKLISMLAQVRDLFAPNAQSPEQSNKLQAHDVDRQLSEQFKNSLLASGRETTSINQENYADMLSTHMRQFSAWLNNNCKGPMASRLHEPMLERDLSLYIRGKGFGYKSVLRDMLTQVRRMDPFKVQLPELGSGAEPSVSSHSSLQHPTAPDGLPPAPQHVWNPDTPAEEATRPALSTQPDALSPTFEFDWGDALYQADVLSHADQRKWDLDTISEQFMAPPWLGQ